MKSQSFSRINVILLNGKARNSFNIIENAGANPRAFSVYLGFAPNSLVPNNFWLDTVVQFPFNFIILKALIVSYFGNVKSVSDFSMEPSGLAEEASFWNIFKMADLSAWTSSSVTPFLRERDGLMEPKT